MLDAGAVQRRAAVTVTAAHAERVEKLAAELGVRGAASNLEARAIGADLVLLAVKPQQVAPVLSSARAQRRAADQSLISVAASQSTALHREALDHPVPVIRAMPNTPALLKQGMTARRPGTHATPDHLEIARSISGAVGRTVTLDEKHMDAVTGLSASGPAFIYIIIESLAEGGSRSACRATSRPSSPRADRARLGRDGARDRRAPGQAQGPGHDARGLHHRRHPRASGGRRAARHAHQGGGARHAARRGSCSRTDEGGI